MSKITIVEEEADEAVDWLELLHELHAISQEDFHNLSIEASELMAIFVASSKTARASSKNN